MKIHSPTRLLTIGAVVAALAAPGLGAQETLIEQRGQLTARDYKFLNETSTSGLAEVELGELAKQRGSTTVIRDLGQRLVTDHNKANFELQQLAASRQALQAGAMSQRERNSIDRLEKLIGVQFDKAFVSAVVKSHKKHLKEFESAAQDLSDPELREFAQKTLPTLREHLRLAQELEGAMKG